ncbi:unnamed protein product [Auanema sp. JU1783]|nr:unnamed protein product [Auanema sp. JU1783]
MFQFCNEHVHETYNMYFQFLIVCLAVAAVIEAAPSQYASSNSQSTEIQQDYRNQNNTLMKQQMRLLNDDYNMMKEQTQSDYRNNMITPQQYRDQMNAHRVDYQQRKEQLLTSLQRSYTSNAMNQPI